MKPILQGEPNIMILVWKNTFFIQSKVDQNSLNNLSMGKIAGKMEQKKYFYQQWARGLWYDMILYCTIHCTYIIISVHIELISQIIQPPPPTPNTTAGRRVRGIISTASCQSNILAHSGMAARLFCCLASHDNNTRVGSVCSSYLIYLGSVQVLYKQVLLNSGPPIPP